MFKKNMKTLIRLTDNQYRIMMGSIGFISRQVFYSNRNL